MIKGLSFDAEIVDSDPLLSLAKRAWIESRREGFEIWNSGSVAVLWIALSEKDRMLFMKRQPKDLDLVIPRRYTRNLKEYFVGRGFEIDPQIQLVSEERRLLLMERKSGVKIDVFVDELRFCHTIDLRERLPSNSITLSGSDLLLSKLQIVDLRKDDQVDVSNLFMACDYGNSWYDLDAEYIANILSKDWGFFKTVSNNLQKVRANVFEIDYSKEIYQRLIEKVRVLEDAIRAKSKSVPWKLRSIIGTKMKWYKEVDDPAHTF